MATTTVSETGKAALPPGVAEAIEEQQTRLWRLRSLLDAFEVAKDSGNDLEDENAVIMELGHLAAQIHFALDSGAIASRAAAIVKQREAEREAEREEVQS